MRTFICLLFARSLSAQQIRTDVETLASDQYEGRGLNTKGIKLAADYLEKRMRAIGLSNVRQQPFRVKTGVALGEGNKLAGIARDDWNPLGFSSSGSFDGQLAFVGYGIDAEPLQYREFEGIDLKGKVAVMLRYEPQERVEASPFDGRKPSRWSAMRYKVLQARERGAAAVVFVTGPLQDEGKDKVPPLANDGPESPAGIPVLQLKRSVAEKWLDLAQFQKDVDADLKPRSRLLDARLSGTVDVKATYAETSNVIGTLPGRGKLAKEALVIGAHYDHLGRGGHGSMRPNSSDIHNGADDNASGTAAVLAIAEKLRTSLADVQDRRTIVFALFSAEESGLGGSAEFVRQNKSPIVAMLNLDMVGNLRDDQLIAFGTESAPEWSAAIARANDLGLKITASGDGYGPSDQTSFYAQRIPVLHFFTGAHERYHTPDDDAASVNYAGIARIAGFTANVAALVARGEVTPAYARAAAAPAMQGDSRGYGAYLGTVPDYSAMESTAGGVLLSDVRPGGPADLAGIQGGDRIVEMAGTRIENLYDMTFALQDHKPGETIDVIVIRKGERVKLRATLGSRKEGAPTAPHGSAPPPPSERHLKDIRQLTNGGENAEAYFSPDGKQLIYQATKTPGGCDQQYVLDLATGESKLVSSGKGRTTCGYFAYPRGERIVYASTEAGGAECPPPPDRSQGYVWPIYPTFDLWEAKPDGSNARRLTTTPGYDAEATWCHQGGKFVFTSTRDGDLDLYEMNDRGDVKRLTSTPGYDGGAFYNADCTELVWRAHHPAGKDLDDYRALLAQGLVRPTVMELFVGKSDGSGARQITNTGAANFCPYFHPDGKRIIYSSNAADPKGREFDLYLIPKTGGTPERVTTTPGFDGFPMFSPDGQWLVWASNRANPAGRDTNLFMARWVE